MRDRKKFMCVPPAENGLATLLHLHPSGATSQRACPSVSPNVASGLYGPPMDACAGGLILHADGTIAGCTHENDCPGDEALHQDSPRSCLDEYGGCDYCGVH